MKTIDIFIVNYNGISNLGNTFIEAVESMLRIHYPKFRVVVIDNGSTDNSIEKLIERFRKDIIIINLPRNYFYAGGLEIGIRKFFKSYGVADYIFVANNDFIIDPDFISESLKFLKKHNISGITQGMVIGPDARIQHAGEFLLPYYSVVRCKGFKEDECPYSVSYISRIHGCCFLIESKKLFSVRQFVLYPYFLSYSEDVEISLNLWSYGIPSVYLPIRAGIHYESATFKRINPIKQYLSHRNYKLIEKKYILKNKFSNLFLLGIANRTLLKFFTSDKYAKRGIIDGIRGKYHLPTSGPYYPLIIVPQFTILLRLSIFPISRFAKDVVNKLIIYTLTKDKINNSPYPFIVPIKI